MRTATKTGVVVRSRPRVRGGGTVAVSYRYEEDGTATPIIEYTDEATDAELGAMVRWVT